MQNSVLSFMERMMTEDSFKSLGDMLATNGDDLDKVLEKILTGVANTFVWQVKPVNVNEIRDYMEAERETLRSL